MREKLNVLEPVAFYGLLLYAGLLLFTITCHVILPGLDSSWLYALNVFAHGPQVFGQDVVLTYGPLAYLAGAEHIGSNLQISAIVHIIVWIVLLSLVVLLRKQHSRFAAFVFLAGLICANRLYFLYWDYLLCAIVIAAMILLLKKPDNPGVLVVLALSIGLMFLVKFSGFIFGMLLLTIHVISRFVLDQNISRREAILLSLGLASGPIAYLIYNPSISGFFGYLRGSMEMSSGYSAAMSLPPETAFLTKALLLCVALIATVVLCFWKRWISAAGGLMVLVTMWIAFKHGFVRPDPIHMSIFFTFFIMAAAFLLAQIPAVRNSRVPVGLACLLLAFGSLASASIQSPVWTRAWWSPAVTLTLSARVLDWKGLVAQLDQASDKSFQTSLINSYLANLSTSRVLFFPWDLSYGSRGQFTTVPLFAMQSYTAYTAYLDQQSAIHIRNASPPIDYVLFEWKNIDDRNPLLDVPATWNALFSGFHPESTRDGTILLKSRGAFLPMEFTEMSRLACPGEAWIEVPQSDSPVALSLALKPTLVGSALSTFYQLERVNLEVQTRSGRSAQFRIPPSVMSSPFPINSLPLGIDDLNILWKDNKVTDPIIRFRLNGPGLPNLNCNGARFYAVTGTSILVI